MRAQDPPPPLTPLDPFDLPEWLGTEKVTWRAEDPVRAGHLVRGRIGRNGGSESLPDHRFGENGATAEAELACDLMAVDDAHPVVVAGEEVRRAAHMAWRHGQVHLVDRDGRATLACPGSSFTADGVLDAVERMARAVGADPARWEVRLLLGGRR